MVGDTLEASEPVRPPYEAVVLLALLALLCVQVAIVIANAGVF